MDPILALAWFAAAVLWATAQLVLFMAERYNWAERARFRYNLWRGWRRTPGSADPFIRAMEFWRVQARRGRKR
jgi:hypothetical protein